MKHQYMQQEYDGTHIICQLPTGLDTFGDLSIYVLRKITSNNSFQIFLTPINIGKYLSSLVNIKDRVKVDPSK